MKGTWSTLWPLNHLILLGRTLKQRGIGQKISFFIAIICYLAAVASLIATFYWGGEIGTDHPVVASFGASVVFFIYFIRQS